MITARNNVLHVCNLDKFIPPFIDFVEANFDDFRDRHLFFITGEITRYPYRRRSNIIQAEHGKLNQLKYYFALVKALHEAEKIILHGLFNQRVVLILTMMPWLLPKCYWVIWGGDLYVYQLGERNRNWKRREFFRRLVIKNVGHLVTYIEGDYDFARQWYGAKGQHQKCFMYTSNLYQDLNRPNFQVQRTEINILIGNSADPSNNHLEIFEKLENFKTRNIKIFVPLTYGDSVHAQKIIEEGSRRFGAKFTVITTHLPLIQYVELLGMIDIAIFNHKRQQAVGNTITLLGLGKKVFMQRGVIQWYFFNSIGVKVFDCEKIDLELLDPKIAIENSTIIQRNFSKDKLIEQLRTIFNSNLG